MSAFSLVGFRVMLGKELREAWRTSRFPVVLVVFFILGMLSPLTAKYTPELLKGVGSGIQYIGGAPTLKDAIAEFVKNVGGDGILVAILLAMGSVARERERGTAAFVLTKPVSRLAFLGAKFVALLTTLTLGLLVAGATAYGYTVFLFGATPALPFAGMVALVWLALVAIMALTFLMSTMLGSTVAAAAGGIGMWILFALISISPILAPYTPNGLTNPAQSVALQLSAAHLPEAIGANIVITLVAFAIAWYAFSRQEQAATAE